MAATSNVDGKHQIFDEASEKWVDIDSPLYEMANEVCIAIEKCGASEELTDASCKAFELMKKIGKMVLEAQSLKESEGKEEE